MRKENRLQTSKTKRNKIIPILIILVVLLICGVGFFQFKTSSDKAHQKNVETTQSTINEGQVVREAMSAMASLYENSSSKELKSGLKKSDLISVKKSVDKLEDGKLKKELTKQLNKIEKQIK